MKSMIAFAALIGAAFAAPVALAQGKHTANRLTTLPAPPPPPGGPGKFARGAQPPTPSQGPSSVPYLGYWPSPVVPPAMDSFAAPSRKPSKPKGGNVEFQWKVEEGES